MTVHRVFGPDGRRNAALFLVPRLLLVFALTCFVIYGVAVVPGVPYHVQALFGPAPTLPRALLFAVVVLFALAPPAALGFQLIRLPARWAWLFPLGMLLHALVVFFAFRFAAPISSVHDLLGLPMWGVGDEVERAVRFVGLFILVSVPFAGGSALVYALTRSYAPGRVLWWVLFAAVLLPLGWWIVVVNAGTQNITALLAAQHPLVSGLGLAAWLVLLAFVGALVAARLASAVQGSLGPVLAVLLVAPLSYGLLLISTGQAIDGPGSTLTALEFLLSPASGEYAFSATGLFLRYGAAYLVVVLLLALAQYPLWASYATRRFMGSGARRDRPGGAADEAALA